MADPNLFKCINKKGRYESRELAERRISGMDVGVVLFAYQCGDCGLWHLTKHNPVQWELNRARMQEVSAPQADCQIPGEQYLSVPQMLQGGDVETPPEKMAEQVKRG